MSQAKRHKALYAKIPPMRCPPDCGECCGPVPLSRWEAQRLPELANAKPSLTCPMFQSGRCTIYSKRPLMCRLFGASDDLPCPKDVMPAGGRLTVGETHQIMDAYLAIDGLKKPLPRPGDSHPIPSNPIQLGRAILEAMVSDA